MSKFIVNYFFVILVFLLLEGVLYLKDYNALLIYDCYIKHEILENDLNSFSSGDLDLKIGEDGKYNIVLKRKSLFRGKRNKKIKYNGIVK